MAMDTVYKGDIATGKATAIKMPDVKVAPAFGEDRAFYDTVSDLGFNAPLPWSQGPRRMGTDKNADLLWVCNSFGSSFARINTRTLETTIVPLPDPTMQAYHIAVDSKHNVWGNLWTSDRIEHLDHVRPAGARHRDPAHRAARARRQDRGRSAGLSHEPDGRPDPAQRGRSRGPEGESALMRLMLFALLAAASVAASAQGYPSRAIHIIAPFPAGGGYDILARVLGAEMT